MRCLALFYLHASNLVKRLGKLLKRYLYYLISHGSHFFCISIMMMVDKLNFYNRCCLKKKIEIEAGRAVSLQTTMCTCIGRGNNTAAR